MLENPPLSVKLPEMTCGIVLLLALSCRGWRDCFTLFTKCISTRWAKTQSTDEARKYAHSTISVNLTLAVSQYYLLLLSPLAMLCRCLHCWLTVFTAGWLPSPPVDCCYLPTTVFLVACPRMSLSHASFLTCCVIDRCHHCRMLHFWLVVSSIDAIVTPVDCFYT